MALSAALGVVALLAGCAGKEPTFGERLQMEGTGLAAIGDQWVEGQEKLERGEALIEEGEDLLDEAEEKIEEGEDLVEEGRQLMQESERRYKELAGS